MGQRLLLTAHCDAKFAWRCGSCGGQSALEALEKTRKTPRGLTVRHVSYVIYSGCAAITPRACPEDGESVCFTFRSWVAYGRRRDRAGRWIAYGCFPGRNGWHRRRCGWIGRLWAVHGASLLQDENAGSTLQTMLCISKKTSSN